MSLFSFHKKEFFTEVEKKNIVQAIRENERRTSGEIRVFVESKCRMVDPLDRAIEIFYGLKMDKTEQHNAVLIYVALKDRQLAVFGDEGIHSKLGQQFWKDEVRQMISSFNSKNYGEGIKKCVEDIGNVLYKYFPFDNDTDKNELPDEIVFGN
jgi:uncharacterized membrane protein